MIRDILALFSRLSVVRGHFKTFLNFVNEQRQFLLSRFEHIIIHVGTSNLKDSQELVGGICCLGHVRSTHKDLELIFVYLFIGETF